MFDTLTNDIGSGEDISISGFGTFKVQQRQARKGRNPQTGEEIEIPARKAVKFKPAKNLREMLTD